MGRVRVEYHYVLGGAAYEFQSLSFLGTDF